MIWKSEQLKSRRAKHPLSQPSLKKKGISCLKDRSPNLVSVFDPS